MVSLIKGMKRKLKRRGSFPFRKQSSGNRHSWHPAGSAGDSLFESDTSAAGDATVPVKNINVQSRTQSLTTGSFLDDVVVVFFEDKEALDLKGGTAGMTKPARARLDTPTTTYTFFSDDDDDSSEFVYSREDDISTLTGDHTGGGHDEDEDPARATTNKEATSRNNNNNNNGASADGTDMSEAVTNVSESATEDGKPSEDVLKFMVSQLTDLEKEAAARATYSYAKRADEYAARRAAATGATGCQSWWTAAHFDARELKRLQNEAAEKMAARHWIANKGDTNRALQSFRATVQYRTARRIDDIRSCFEKHDDDDVEEEEDAVEAESEPKSGSDNEEESLNNTADLGKKELQRRVRKYIGPKGRMFVRGYDRDGRACFHFIVRNSPKQKSHIDAADGCLEAHYYILEKAIACTEQRTNGKEGTVIVSVDFEGFQKWHAPPNTIVLHMLEMLMHHYPERLHRVYLVNAPFLFRAIYSIFRPFIDPVTKEKFQFVTGKQQCKEVFGEAMEPSQAMPYQLPNRGEMSGFMDIDEHYQLPVDRAYDEV